MLASRDSLAGSMRFRITPAKPENGSRSRSTVSSRPCRISKCVIRSWAPPARPDIASASASAAASATGNSLNNRTTAVFTASLLSSDASLG